MELQILIAILFFLLTITALGTVIYLYLRQEQDKLFPKTNMARRELKNLEKGKPGFDVSTFKQFLTWQNFQKKSNRFSLLLITFGIALLTSAAAVSVPYGIVFPYIIMLLITVAPISVPSFPWGLTVFIDPANGIPILLIGWFAYLAVFLIGSLTNNRSVFVAVYIAFIILLIMNIYGCARITPEFLSGIQ